MDVVSNSVAKTNDSRDVVFTFYQETWANAVGRVMYMSGPRLLSTLISEPSVRRLLVANPYRSAPIQWARRLSGQWLGDERSFGLEFADPRTDRPPLRSNRGYGEQHERTRR